MKSFNDYQKDLNEADFGSMAAQLKKYGGKDNVKDAPKAPQARSKYAPDYTMTGHKEKTTSTGKQYSKVLPDYDDEDDVKSAKKSVATGAAPQEKRGRGRPKGVGAKAGQYKPRDPAKKAESAAKAAATKAANKAKKAALTQEDCEEIFEGLDFDDMIEMMVDEEMMGLDEVSKATLGSYVKKSSMDLGSKFYDSGRDETKDKKSSYYNFRAAEKRQRGINKAVAKLTKEDLDEAEKIKVGSIVTPKIGPHAGRPHTVIHVHDDGSFNIKPNVDSNHNKYRLGAARCTKDQLHESAEEINEMYHAGGTINSAGKTSNWKVKYEDFPDKKDIQKQNPHLDSNQVYAIHNHISDHADDDMTGTKSTHTSSGGYKGNTAAPMRIGMTTTHKVHVTSNGGHMGESVEFEEFSLEDLMLFIESEDFNSLDENELALFEGIFNESSDAVVKDKSGKVIKFKHTGDWEKKKEDPIVDKSGAKHTAHSRVRDLARNAIKRVGKSEISFAKNESEESLSKEVKVPHDGAMNPTKIHMSHVDDLVKSGKYKYFSAHGAPGYPASILRHVASGKKVNISTGNRDHSTFTHVHRVLESEEAGTQPAINDAVAYYAKNINTNLIKE